MNTTATNNSAAREAGHWDEVGFIMDFEDGNVTKEQLIDGFQHLIDNGHAWTLQGFYGRTAIALIEAGHCRRRSQRK